MKARFREPVKAGASNFRAGRFGIFSGGPGTCGRCNCGPVYFCKEGPVFTMTDTQRLPADY